MTLEPSWSIPIVAITGLAGLYVWYLLSQASLFNRLLAYPREHWDELWNCPWCVSAWTTAFMLVVTGNFDPITWLASAGVAGFLGSKSG